MRVRNSWLILVVLTACTSAPRRPAGDSSSGAAVGGQVFRLHSGKKVLLPKRSDSVDYVFLQGSADLQALNQILAPEDLVALPGPDNRGSVGVIVAKYNSSSLGAYQEVLVVISAQSNALKDTGASAGSLPYPMDAIAPPSPYFVWSSYVDSRLALDVDREVWGFADAMATIELNTHTPDWTFRFSAPGKAGLALEGKCGSCGLAGKQKLPAHFTLISSYALRRSWVPVENSGATLVRPYDAAVDTFLPKGALAARLKKIDFRPYGWFVGEGLSAEAGRGI